MAKKLNHESRRSFLRWGLHGQNDGTPTIQQLKQSSRDKLKFRLAHKTYPAIRSNSIIPFARWTLGSSSNFKRNKYAPVVGSKMKVIPAHQYNPQPKAPSRRDKHRMEVAERN